MLEEITVIMAVTVAMLLLITEQHRVIRPLNFQQLALIATVKMHGNQLIGIMMRLIFQFTVASTKASGIPVPIVIPLLIIIVFSTV
jgi:hypothetical protein